MKILPNHILTSGVSLNQRSLVHQLKDASNESQSNQHNQIKASQKRSRDELNDSNEIGVGHNIDTGFLNNIRIPLKKNISQSKRQKVDPQTGKRSDAEDAISRTTFRCRQKVDSEMGKPSDYENAIKRNTFLNSDGAINNSFKKNMNQSSSSSSRNQLNIKDVINKSKISSGGIHGRYLVDPETGKPSDDKNAIPRTTFAGRQ